MLFLTHSAGHPFHLLLPCHSAPSSFILLITALGYDIPSHTPSLISQAFDTSHQCLASSCDTSPPSIHVDPPQPSVDASTRDIPSPSPEVTPKVLPPSSAPWPSQLSTLHPLNISWTKFSKKQREDKWLRPLINYLMSNNDISVLRGLSKKDQSWVISTAKRSAIIDGLLMYSDEFVDDCNHFRVFVQSDSQLQKHFLHAYDDSPMGMHHCRNATFYCLSCDFYWHNMSKQGG